jgi:hypothetical protein
MTVSTLVQNFSVNNEVSYIYIKFSKTIHASSITNSAFSLTSDDATPVIFTDPFETIDVTDSNQYNSIARELFLYIKNSTLSASTGYTLNINGLYDAAGTSIALDTCITFTTPSDYNATYDDDLPATVAAVQIEDHSVKRNIYNSVQEIAQSNVNFYIESTDPINQDWYIEPDYNNGRVIVKFSTAPSASFLNNKFVTVQRKPIQRQAARWETLAVNILLDTDEPWMYIDFPSYDHYPEAATPSTNTVYTTNEYGYFEEGYKYRISMSKSIGS